MCGRRMGKGEPAMSDRAEAAKSECIAAILALASPAAAQASQAAVKELEYKPVGSLLFTGWTYEATSSDDPRGIRLYRPAQASTSGERQEGGAA